jgi:hypothetical protein
MKIILFRNPYSSYLSAICIILLASVPINLYFSLAIIGKTLGLLSDPLHFAVSVLLGIAIPKNKPLLFFIALAMGALALHYSFLKIAFVKYTFSENIETIFMRFLAISILACIIMLIKIMFKRNSAS